MATYEITINERTAEGKNFLKMLKESNNVQIEKVNDPYRMGGKKELDALFEQAHKEQKEGRCARVKLEDIDAFIEEL